MSFEEYMNKELPNYKEILSVDKINQLKIFYEYKENFRKVAETNLETGMSSNIDKSNRYEKAMSDMVRYSNMLNQEIERIKDMDSKRSMSW